MSKRHMVTLHHNMAVYNDMFDHMDGIRQAVAKKKIQWKEDLYFAVKFARHMLSKCYAEVTAMLAMVLISAHILDLFQMLQSLRQWDKGMDIHPEDKTSYTTQYQEAFLKYVENAHCAKHTDLPVIEPKAVLSNNLVSSAMPSRTGESSSDQYDRFSDDKEYFMPKSVAEMMPGQSDCAACLLTAAKLYLNSPPESPQNWEQIDPNLNDFHSDTMESGSTLWLLDITDWWLQQEETQSMYPDLSNVAHDVFENIPHRV